ncbi:MAG TPA: molybdenum cofactor guanylyltransferase [Elusimicrobiales bacterium]|nr:molybdenum cofactor guanylyltransferase [Elusimicrobiales bacterium]
MSQSNIAGCILAGGKSTRMGGRPKGLIEIDGRPIVELVLQVFKNIFNEIILVTNTPALYSKYDKDCLIVTDIIKGIGPLGGIYTGLKSTAKKAVFFTACDMPNLHNDLILRQLKTFQSSNFQAFVAEMGGFTEPLHAIYKTELAHTIKDYVAKHKDYSLRGFLKTVNTGYFKLENINLNKEIFKNINTPGDLL